MRTRNKGYLDYGFLPGEEKLLKEWCKKSDFSEEVLLLESAKIENKDIFNDIYFSIVKGLSYEKMDKNVSQYIGKGDFYGHQRKTLAIFRKALIKCGKYPFWCADSPIKTPKTRVDSLCHEGQKGK